MGIRKTITRIRDSRNGDTTDPLDLAQEEFVTDTFGPEPEHTDPGGADLTAPATPPIGAICSAQTLYGPDQRRCPVAGCGVPCLGEICLTCTANGHLPPGVDGYVPPGLERVLPDPPLRSSWLTEVILDGEDADLPTLDQCGPDATVSVLYPGGDAA